MKKLFFLINLILIFLLTSLSVFAENVDNGNQSEGTADTATEIVYRAPDEIRGVLVSPGEDFATEKGQSEETVKEQINNIINTADSYGLNTIYLNLQNREGVIYISDYYPVYTSFDALSYFIEQAKANEIYVYAIVNPCYVAAGDILYDYGYIYRDVLVQSQKNISEIVSKYDVDAILVEGYYNSINENSFEQYKSSSAGMGFDQW
ncbi:MAG: hypothetical protein J6J58_08110, partial [Oscillospiraceae bacterium]|nr:hypothetical protein [Oscillospiraceae bacterium]